MQLKDLSSPEFIANPYPFYQKLRASGPLLQVGPNTFLATQFATVDALFSDKRIGKSYMDTVRIRYGDKADSIPLFSAFSRMFLMLNPPDHSRIRGLMMKAFNVRKIDSLREMALAIAHELIDQIEDQGTLDLTKDFAFPLPVRIICKMLDVPVSDATKLGLATGLLVKAFDPSISEEEIMQANEAFSVLDEYFSAVIHQRREQPGDDLISLLVHINDGGETLTHDEIVSNVVLLFLAGHETTTNMISNSLIALFRHPEQLAQIKHNPELLPNAVLECLRYDSSVQMTMRTALEEVEIDGVKVPKEAMILLLIGAANRDAGQFDQPEQLDITRRLGRSLAFGAGIHHCMGHRLALIELESALSVLLTRLPNLQLQDLDNLEWIPRANLRGVSKLIASF